MLKHVCAVMNKKDEFSVFLLSEMDISSEKFIIIWSTDPSHFLKIFFLVHAFLVS